MPIRLYYPTMQKHAALPERCPIWTEHDTKVLFVQLKTSRIFKGLFLVHVLYVYFFFKLNAKGVLLFTNVKLVT